MTGHTPWREIKHKAKPVRWYQVKRRLKKRKQRKALEELTRISETFPGGYR